ncbi:HNH endonuclease [Calidifontibacter sp. DB0510]|uniref:HNH endonuclease n=1 Tax=Metallococcus carri TaxID=1656884 RepID=A0A967E8Q0_9MICO|nr:HNH endonuclease signature motif containing protein [Metallococcus carri]NHN54420.1 HNH endonuclease [Metallococcus carri]NOP36741.1 hypothetical protein [Calidifontibacter sp. DB2511S]
MPPTSTATPSNRSAGLLADAARLVSQAFELLANDDATIELPRQEFAALAGDCEQLRHRIEATQVVAMARYAAIEETTDPDTGQTREVHHPLGHAEEFADTDLGTALNWSPRTASGRLSDAVTAAERTPRLLRMAGHGQVGMAQVRAVGDELLNASPATCAVVEDDVIRAGITGWTTRQTARRTRTLVLTWETGAARQAATRERRRELGVWFTGHHIHGLTSMTAVLPSELAATVHGIIEDHAHHLRDMSATSKTLAEHRVDALTDLISAQAEVTTTLVFHVPVRPSDDGHTRALGDVTIPGIGHIPAEVITRLTRDLDTTLVRALTDPATGVLHDTSSDAYRPGIRIRRFLETRDQHCRFPTCDTPARACEADHVTPWPNGPTTPANLQLLCKHHHRVKHESNWSVTMTDDGVCTWTSPHGNTYITEPENTTTARLDRAS